MNLRRTYLRVSDRRNELRVSRVRRRRARIHNCAHLCRAFIGSQRLFGNGSSRGRSRRRQVHRYILSPIGLDWNGQALNAMRLRNGIEAQSGRLRSS